MQAWWENVILIGIEMALKIWNWHRVQFANFPDQFSHLTFAKCAFVKSVYFIRRSLFFVSQIGKKVKVSFSERKVCKTCPGLSSNYWGFWDRFTSSHPLLFPSFLPASTPPAKKFSKPLVVRNCGSPRLLGFAALKKKNNKKSGRNRLNHLNLKERHKTEPRIYRRLARSWKEL